MPVDSARSASSWSCSRRCSRKGPGAALYAILDRVVDAYDPVVDGVLEDIEEVEAEVFSPQGANPVERIYRLRREVLEFARATGPLRPTLRELTLPGVPNID